MNNCGYTGYDLDTRYDVNSLMHCGEACFNRKDCNYFTFASPMTCALKKISDTTLAFYTGQWSICGMFPDRLPKSFCQWQTSEDGSYQWANNCTFSSGINGVSVNFPSAITNMADCAEQCKANGPKCNNFEFLLSNGQKYCYLYNSPGLTVERKSFAYTIGMITARKFNVEFIPIKQPCSLARKVTTTTTQDPFQDIDDYWVMA